MFLFRIPFLLLSVPLFIARAAVKLCSELVRIALISLVFFAVAAQSTTPSGTGELQGDLGQFVNSLQNTSFAEVSTRGVEAYDSMKVSFSESFSRIEKFMTEKLHSQSSSVSPACLKTDGKGTRIDTSAC